MSSKSNRCTLFSSAALAVTLLISFLGPTSTATSATEGNETGPFAITTLNELPQPVAQVDTEARQAYGNGTSVRVAILDTGIDLDHPDLRVAGDVSFVDYALDGDDDNGHGTMVAGVIAALDNGVGVVGVAPEVELYAVKVLDGAGKGRGSSILDGIEWAIDNQMQVVVMSFGSTMTLPREIMTALDRASQAGIVLVAGTGNTGDQGVVFAPASHDAVIAVGATDQQDGGRAQFSATGSDLELMAPGVGIVSTNRGGGYGTANGTSLAAPHVAGVAALLISAGVTDSEEVREILRNTARDLGPQGWDPSYGYGSADAAEAIAAVVLSAE